MSMKLLILGALIAGILLPLAAAANGGFIPDVAYPKLPGIPEQTALIIHDGKQETLIVESAFQAKEQGHYAWVLPIPAAPVRIEKVSAGTLETLRFIVGPEVRNASNVRVGTPIMLLLVSICLTVWGTKKSQRAFELLIVILILWGLVAISVGGIERAEASAQLLSTQRVGNYEVAVLKANDTDGVNEFLQSNGFRPLDDASSAVVQKYLDKGWVLLASRLLTDANGISKPHPLKVTFPCTDPVFPMMLTGMNGSPTSVNLYIAARQPMRHPLFRLEYSGIIHRYSFNEQESVSLNEGYNQIEHAALAGLLPDQFWLTNLRATLQPHQMIADDIVLQSADPVAFRRVYYSRDGRRAIGFCAAFLCLSLVFPISGFTWYHHKRAGTIVAAIGLLATVAVAAAYASTIEVKDGYSFRTGARSTVPPAISPDPMLGKEPSALREMMRDKTNFLTGEPIQEIDSPGNYTIEVDKEGEARIVRYTQSGKMK